MPLHPTPPISLKESLSVMLEILDATRTLIRKALIKGFSFRSKPDHSYVTDVDIRVEKEIRKRIKKAFPSHNILGEELSFENHRSDFLWVIDPIDGTHSFKNRIPLYGTMISLCFHGNPVAGAIDLPEINRCFTGARGLGTRLNG
ncbi:MAG: inositol monophosphatase family protein, partial [Thermodesulfobacteriota bacterium]